VAFLLARSAAFPFLRGDVPAEENGQNAQ